MSDEERRDDLEWRLHALMTHRAEGVHPHLDGPTLRARAERFRRSRRFPLPAVVSAGLVSAGAAAIVAAVVVTGSPDDRPQPGGGITVGPSSGPSVSDDGSPASPTSSPLFPIRSNPPTSTPSSTASLSTHRQPPAHQPGRTRAGVSSSAAPG